MSDAATEALIQEIADLRGEVDELRKQHEQANPPPLTEADLDKMNREEMLDRWDEVQSLLEQGIGGKPAASAGGDEGDE